MGDVARFRKSGFTLLEMILAIGLMITILAGLFAFYQTAITTEKEASETGHEAAVARELLQRMSDELRQVTGVVNGFAVSPLIAESNPPRITFYTRVLPDKRILEQRSLFDDKLPPQHDLRRISYYLLMDENYEDENGDPMVFGIVREEEKTLLQDVVVKEFEVDAPPEEQFTQLDLYAPELKFLEFRFYDGAQWVRRWRGGPGASLPQAIRIVIGRTPEYREDEQVDKVTIDEDEQDDTIDFRQHPDRYVEIVRMTGADPYFGSRLVTAQDALGSSE